MAIDGLVCLAHMNGPKKKRAGGGGKGSSGEEQERKRTARMVFRVARKVRGGGEGRKVRGRTRTTRTDHPFLDREGEEARVQ